MVSELERLLREDNLSLSKGQRKLAQYVSENHDDVAFLTTGRLAEKADVSEATITRFVRFLGYAKFGDFKSALQEDIKSRITSTVKIKDTVEKLSADDHVFTNWLRIDQAMLNELEHSCSEEQIDRAASCFTPTSAIYLVGFGVSRSIVEFLDFRFSRLRYKVIPIVSGGSAVFDKLMSAGSNDVLIGIGFFRPHREVLVALDIAAKRSMARIAITDSDSAPVAANADVVLKANRGPADIMTSLAAPMTVANILTVAVANKYKESAIETLSSLDSLKDTYHL